MRMSILGLFSGNWTDGGMEMGEGRMRSGVVGLGLMGWILANPQGDGCLSELSPSKAPPNSSYKQASRPTKACCAVTGNPNNELCLYPILHISKPKPNITQAEFIARPHLETAPRRMLILITVAIIRILVTIIVITIGIILILITTDIPVRKEEFLMPPRIVKLLGPSLLVVLLLKISITGILPIVVLFLVLVLVLLVLFVLRLFVLLLLLLLLFLLVRILPPDTEFTKPVDPVVGRHHCVCFADLGEIVFVEGSIKSLSREREREREVYPRESR
ncbi:hypothetical protein BO99DRAFT_223006 [Aspergillus violaceofuscus CBS 115571]|uniref:Uncharacterized protein n=1 Tax=Aspergillus violaceofuscus (strain CBS 115571) TaxID=1450538 RepID=A0A2V5HLY7_ASPV1|nr:hypothetical protein BO99DRAFT_223006 [Aspergillus violaceofuscus CBS 115571]